MKKNIFKKGNTRKGFALFYAALFSAMILLIGLAIFSVTLKEFLLSSSMRESTIAFYAADSGIECAMYWDLFGVTDSNGAKVSAFPNSSQTAAYANNIFVSNNSVVCGGNYNLSRCNSLVSNPTSCVCPGSAINLLANGVMTGDFESSIEDFHVYGPATISRDTTASKFGNASLKIVTTGWGGAMTYSIPTNLIVGTTYTFSFWAKTDTGSLNALTMVQDGSGSLNCLSNSSFTVTSSWQRFSKTCALNMNEGRLYIVTSTPGTIYIDGLQLTVGNFLTPFPLSSGVFSSIRYDLNNTYGVCVQVTKVVNSDSSISTKIESTGGNVSQAALSGGTSAKAVVRSIRSQY